MMRYQRVSPDFAPLSNGKKNNAKTCKEDGLETKKSQNQNGDIEGKAPRIKTGSNPSMGHDSNTSQYVSVTTENNSSRSQITKHEKIHSGDVLFQWGHSKRSRRSRSESRLFKGESLGEEKQGIRRRLVSAVEKQPTANLRPLVPVSFLNRNSDVRSGSVDGFPPSNGNGRIVSRPSGKRSPPSPSEKTDKASPSSVAPISEKLNGKIVQSPSMNVESVPQPDPESVAPAEKPSLDQMEWPRIYIGLSRKEKEEDFFKMKGTKLPQRPKKRAKNIDRTLQYCFPGMWLSDLTKARYEVREKKCVKKRRRGLKGMESMDSDSE